MTATPKLQPGMQTVTQRGYIDALTTSGFAVGWALDTRAPLRPLTVMILGDGQTLGVGTASCFREDLMEHGIGAGWCAFRVRLSVSVRVAHKLPLVLIDRASRTLLHAPRAVPLAEDGDSPIHSIPDLLETDPTLLGPLERLSGCAAVLTEYIKRRGVEGFIRAAYAYILSRPADTAGLRSYSEMIRRSVLEPLDIIRALASSDEFSSRPRMLAAPNTAAFPFRLD